MLFLASPMHAFGRTQRLFEPRPGGVVSDEPATGNGLIPPTAHLPLNLPPKREAMSKQYAVGSKQKGQLPTDFCLLLIGSARL